MSEIAQQIINELRDDKLGRHSVWIWYDPREKYRGIVNDVTEALETDDIRLVEFGGSYLELKAKLWKDDAEIDDKWVFYIPASQSDAEWFKDIHKLGKMYRPTVDVSDDPAATYLVERTEKIPEDFSEWGTDPEQLDKAFFSVLFRQNHYNPRDFLLEFLSGPTTYIDLIKRYEQEDTWARILHNEYGIEDPLDPIEIAKSVLFADVEVGAPTDRYADIAASTTNRAADFCEYWQQNRASSYLEYANDIEQDYNLRHAVIDSDSTDWDSDAFVGIDRGLIHLCLNWFEAVPEMDFPDEVEGLQKVVNRRKQSFWFHDGRADYWTVLDHGLDVIQGATNAQQQIEESGFSIEELTERYATEWWQVDASYRNYVQSANELIEAFEGLGTAKQVITRFYTRFLKSINRTMAETIAANPALVYPQTEFWSQYVEAENGTAIIICDALRYELAQGLVDQLNDLDASISSDAMSAALPSITEVGMAAHLPGKLDLDIDDGQLRISTDGTVLKTKSDRDAIFESEGFKVTSLSELSTTSVAELQTEEQVPLVAYSGLIDQLGESIDDEQALGQATDHINDVERVVRKLKSAGYTRFIVTADHGFLYTERLPDDLKIDLEADVEVLKRRFAATKGLPLDEPSLITFEPDDLREIGIESNGVSLSFPRSVACFTAPGGNMRYFHGGISIQELLVPCVRIEAEIDETPERQFEVAVSFPTAITNNIVSVNLEPEGQMSIGSEREIILRARVGDKEVCKPVSTKISHSPEKERLKLRTGDIEDTSSVVFEALDGETREIIATQRAKLDMIIRDEGFDI